MIKEHVVIPRHSNTEFPYEVLIDQFVDALMIGFFRYSYTNCLKYDPGYKKVKGRDIIADESTVRKALQSKSYFLLRPRLHSQSETL